MINNGNILAQASNMVHLLIGHTDLIKVADSYRSGCMIFVTTVEHSRKFAFMFNDHGWAVEAQAGLKHKDRRYIKVMYNKPQRLMNEADIAKLMS